MYSRAAPGAPDVDDDAALHEEHWAYMDRFADGMIARGPTLATDRATWTGSLHIVDLPSVQAAHQFVEREPYNRAGRFERHLIRRFRNLLGRTMWEAPGGFDDPRFLVIAHAPAEVGEHIPAVPLPDVAAPAREHLIVHGDLLSPDAVRSVGIALALQAPTRQAVDALLNGEQGRLHEHYDVQIHDWEFGGRR